jgi:hypothetical protein
MWLANPAAVSLFLATVVWRTKYILHTISQLGWPQASWKVLLTQGDTKRCRLSLLTSSALVYEPKCGRRGWGLLGLSQTQQMGTAVHKEPKIYFGDLTPYLTYMLTLNPFPLLLTMHRCLTILLLRCGEWIARGRTICISHVAEPERGSALYSSYLSMMWGQGRVWSR